jgi:hypothetical protein
MIKSLTTLVVIMLALISRGFLMAVGVLLALHFFPPIALGYEILEPTKVILEGEKYDIYRDPYMYNETDNWVYGAALTTQFTLLGQKENNWRLFYDPTLGFKATEEQVRYGSLYYELGGEFLQERGLRLFRRHYSGHVFERFKSDNKYPVMDSWVAQLVWELK